MKLIEIDLTMGLIVAVAMWIVRRADGSDETCRWWATTLPMAHRAKAIERSESSYGELTEYPWISEGRGKVEWRDLQRRIPSGSLHQM